MPSANLRDDLYCARYNGQWASEIRLDLDPNDGHSTGFDYSTGMVGHLEGSSNYLYSATEWNGGHAGNRQIWNNDERVFYASNGPRFGSLSGVYDTGTYAFDRSWGDDGTTYLIRHSAWSNRNGQALALPLPTYTLSVSGNSGWRSSGGSEPGSAVVNKDLSWTHAYQSWSNNIVKDPIVAVSYTHLTLPTKRIV